MNKVALTIDVEDWFCVRNFSQAIAYDRWESCEQRLSVGLDFVLDELEKRNIRATFFVLGWIAERNPDAVRRIAQAGHEIGSHGYSHQGIDCLTPEAFDQEIKRSVSLLQEITGQTVMGFRAPSFSVTDKTLWALDILRENRLAYDSSVFVIRHPNYGIPSFSPKIQQVKGIIEFPLTASRLGKFRVPVAGGGYFRLLPYALIRRLIRRSLQEGPLMTYFHPWEFDPEQPRVRSLGPSQRFRHYVGLRRNRAKFRRFLDEFEFTTVANVLSHSGFDLARSRSCH